MGFIPQITCRHCGKKFSGIYNRCPHCGTFFRGTFWSEKDAGYCRGCGERLIFDD